jgi:hypothetical protein
MAQSRSHCSIAYLDPEAPEGRVPYKSTLEMQCEDTQTGDAPGASSKSPRMYPNIHLVHASPHSPAQYHEGPATYQVPNLTIRIQTVIRSPYFTPISYIISP